MGIKPGGSPIALNVAKGVEIVEDVWETYRVAQLKELAKEMDRKILENLRKK